MIASLVAAGLLLLEVAGTPKPFDPCMAAGVRDTVLFIGTSRSSPGSTAQQLTFFGTGFLVEVDRINYLFTARHVVTGFLESRKSTDPFLVAGNLRKGGRVVQSFDTLTKEEHVGWVLSDRADVAAIPLPTKPEFQRLTIPLDIFAEDDQIAELEDVFFVSYQPNLEAADRIRPIVRRGMVAVADPGEVYLDAFVFPGNSGSPVFIRASVASAQPGLIALGTSPLSCKFIGLVQEYIPYQEIAVSVQTQRPRVMFEENTGLARVLVASEIRRFIQSPSFQAQHARILKLEDHQSDAHR